MTLSVVLLGDFPAVIDQMAGWGWTVIPTGGRGGLALADAVDSDLVARWLAVPSQGLVQLRDGQVPPPPARFLDHLSRGGVGLGLRTATAYDLELARVLVSALAGRLAVQGRAALPDLEFVIHELLTNALIHGNLAIADSLCGDVAAMARFGVAVERGLDDPVRAARMVWVSAAPAWGTVEIAIEDEGDGFDLAHVRVDTSRPHGLELVRAAVLRLRQERGGRRTVVTVATAEAEFAAPVFSDASVLVVDDNPANRTIFEALLKRLGVGRVESAADGLAGLEAVARHKPDLVLLDVMMPRMDGLEMCRRLRQDYPLAELPVLFVTALDDARNRRDCFAVGGNDVVAKPIDPNEVLARSKVHLHNALLLAAMRSYRQRVGEELADARRAQAALAPTEEQIRDLGQRLGLDVDGLVESSSELGGDFWTLFPVGPDQLGVLVADFTGHGLRAAFNVFRLHVLLGRLPRHPPSPGRLLEILNTDLKELLRPGEFAAVFCCVVDVTRGLLTYAAGAAPPPVLVENGQARLLPVAGPPLGAFDDAEYDEHTVAMGPGACLVVYSDALIEAQTAGQAVCDEGRLLEWVTQAAAQPRALSAQLWENFHRHWPGEPPDDLTLVGIRRPGPVGTTDA